MTGQNDYMAVLERLIQLPKACYLIMLQNALAEQPRKQFGMYGDDVETHLAAKLMHCIERLSCRARNEPRHLLSKRFLRFASFGRNDGWG